MTMDKEPETRGPVALPLVSSRGVYLVVITTPLVVLFFRWNLLNEYVLEAARQLFG
jgi:hypothetical protein